MIILLWIGRERQKTTEYKALELLIIKLALYKEAGVHLYWLVDIERQTIVVYDLEHEAIPALYHFTDSVPVEFYTDFKIDFDTIEIL